MWGFRQPQTKMQVAQRRIRGMNWAEKVSRVKPSLPFTDGKEFPGGAWLG